MSHANLILVPHREEEEEEEEEGTRLPLRGGEMGGHFTTVCGGRKGEEENGRGDKGEKEGKKDSARKRTSFKSLLKIKDSSLITLFAPKGALYWRGSITLQISTVHYLNTEVNEQSPSPTFTDRQRSYPLSPGTTVSLQSSIDDTLTVCHFEASLARVDSC